MTPGRIALGIILFALVTAILYVWGLRKAMSQDPGRQLRNKCAAMVLRRLKGGGTLSRKEIEAMVDGVRAGPFWSRRKAVVMDAKAFAGELIDYLLDQGYLAKSGKDYRRA